MAQPGTKAHDLLIPIEALGIRTERVEFKPVTYDQAERWDAGEIGSIKAFLSEVTGLSEESIGFLTYPDAQIVIDIFMAHIPPRIAASIVEGRVPVRVDRPAAQGSRPEADEVYTHPERPDEGDGFGMEGLSG